MMGWFASEGCLQLHAFQFVLRFTVISKCQHHFLETDKRQGLKEKIQMNCQVHISETTKYQHLNDGNTMAQRWESVLLAAGKPNSKIKV